MDPISVTQLNNRITNTLSADPELQHVVVFGSVSNLRPNRSGHYYFSIKDEKSTIDVALWSSVAARTRIGPKLENGLLVIIRGSISFYGPYGKISLICEAIEVFQKSDLQERYEALKAELLALGYFDAEHKQPLPSHPAVVAVVTSSTGAVLQDVRNVLGSRNPLVEVRNVDVPVQGAGAAPKIAEGIAKADADPEVDLIIVGRGGGSMEDLWPFNEREVVEAIYRCKTPIISAVGHETDVTLSDFASDARASTPSHAAEMASPTLSQLLQELSQCEEGLHLAMSRYMDEKANMLRRLSEALTRPLMAALHGQNMALMRLENSLVQRWSGLIGQEQQGLVQLAQRLELLNPLQILSQGYGRVLRDGSLVKAADLSQGDDVDIVLEDGSVKAKVSEVTLR